MQSRQIIDDGFEHSLTVYQDHKSGGLRLHAAVWNGELRKCPVWTAFGIFSSVALCCFVILGKVGKGLALILKSNVSLRITLMDGSPQRPSHLVEGDTSVCLLLEL